MKKYIEEKNVILRCIPMIITSIIFSTILIFTIKIKFEEDIKNNINEVNQQVVKSIQYKLYSQLEGLIGIANKISNEKNEIIRNELMKNLHEFNKSSLYGIHHIINIDGYTICEDEEIYLGESEYFKRALEDEVVISNPIKNKIGDKYEESIIFLVPIKINGDIISVIESVYTIEHIQELLYTSMYPDDEISKQSTILLFDKNYNLIMSNISKNDIKETTDKVLNKKDVYTIYTDLMDDGNWNLLTITPKQLASENMSNIINILVILTLIWNLILFRIKFSSVKKEQIHNKKLKKIAYEDKLTGLDNYEKFILDLEKKLKYTNEKFMIVCFDIKRFKFINQVLGHSVGDEILNQIAKNIIKYIEGNSKYTRINNDLFVIAMKANCKKINIEDIVKLIRENIITEGIYKEIIKSNDIKIDTSIGIYIIENNSESIKKMVDYADLARIKSKKLNTESYYIFDKEILKEEREIINIEKDIYTALKHNQFKVYYQPKVCTRTKKVVGAEALIRWIKEDGNFIRPDKFIPIAEKNGTINLIGRWVLVQVCKDLKKWKQKGYNIVPISINISRLEFYQSDLISYIKDTLDVYNINPNLIELEITETLVLNDTDYISNKIREIKELGIKISMDDFGTGNSSISNLKSTPIDILKIDRSLSLNIEKNEKSKQIVKMIINLSKKLGYSVVCEGIEYIEQVEILKNMDCDIIQGFVFYRPMTSDDLESIIKEL